MYAEPVPTSLSADDRRAATRALFKRATAAKTAAEHNDAICAVIELNIGLAHALAARYARRGVPIDDLRQVAALALTRAAQNFDPELADDFLAYAVPTIRGELRKHFRDHAWVVRPPRSIQELQPRIAEARARLEQHGTHHPSTAEIAEDLGEPTHAVADAEEAEGCFSPVSLDAPQRIDGQARIETMADTSEPYEAVEAGAVVWPALRCLNPREQTIVRLRFFDQLTQREIGERIGISQMQVSRVLRGILDKLRCQVGDTLTDGELRSA